ncbi:MAG: hypothetical protein A2018_00535 [Alphaproteobacteria bacterium GWF2_58_20]|nr:MAG: hypothetical protein A2018_00535 [Alphaproteobacteria bacterium GWF2_58_20]
MVDFRGDVKSNRDCLYGDRSKMKKILFGASALALMVGSASAAEALKLGLGGYYNVYGVYVSQDDGATEPGANTHNFDIKRDAEVSVMGSTKLDNGMVVGAQIDLTTVNAISANAANGESKSNLFMSGNFGKVVIGEEYAASYLLQVASPSVDDSFDGINPKFELFNRAANIAPNAMAMNVDNSAKISYLSPVMSGFQAGVSITPDTVGGLTFAGMRNDNATGFQILDLGMKYSGAAAGTTFDVGVGYSKSDAETAAAAEPSAYNLGLNVGFGAFKVGAGYVKNDADAANLDSSAYQLGVTYDMGAYTVGASYFHGEQEVGVAGTADDKNARIVVGGTYTYGPGMTFKGSIQHFDLDSATATDKNAGYAIVLGTNVNF